MRTICLAVESGYVARNGVSKRVSFAKANCAGTFFVSAKKIVRVSPSSIAVTGWAVAQNNRDAVAEIKIERPNKTGVCRNGDWLRWKYERAGRKVERKLRVGFCRHFLKPLIIVHEHKAVGSI